MSEPRIRPISKDAATGTQRLLIETAEVNGAPDPLCAQIYVRSEAGRNWLRHWNELLNGGILPVPLKEMCRVLISMKHGCGYCSTVRSRIAYKNGLTEEKLMATMDFEQSPLFDDRNVPHCVLQRYSKAATTGLTATMSILILKSISATRRSLSWPCCVRKPME